jgi:hypothetical protein
MEERIAKERAEFERKLQKVRQEREIWRFPISSR